MIARVYIGYDPREDDAYRVAEASLKRNASIPVEVTPLRLDKLQNQMLIWRRFERHGAKLWDCISKAYCSTEFAISRFFTPLLAHEGWALFVDCDVVFTGDVAELFALADPRFAVMCVQHEYTPDHGVKMGGQTQEPYPRKAWSSCVLFNASHPAHTGLHLGLLNNTPGRDLHRFCWVHDSELGALPPEWNVLVGVQPMPANPRMLHYTLGTPNLAGCGGTEHAEIWWDEFKRLGQ